MRQWSPAAQDMLLRHLTQMPDMTCPTTEMWRVTKGDRPQ